MLARAHPRGQRGLILGYAGLGGLHRAAVAVFGRSGNRAGDAALIEIEGLTKRFGTFTAVDRVSFTVPRGEVLGFLGPNGAGKSTTMRMLAGFVTPTEGTARVAGFDVQTRPVQARRELGFLPEGAPTYPDMTVIGFLGFCAGVRGYHGAARNRRVEQALALTGLEPVAVQPVETLSKGFKRRVGLAQALLHDPPVLVLDEPTDGLDPNQKHEVRTLIRRMAPEKAIVISTHILEEVDAVCTRAIVIAAGRIVADDTPAALERLHPSGRLDDVFRALTTKQAA
ncbi:MAG: ABC transporter ATP-binding protein [Proteobacteria bacterium]|nr:ABC transporter ATP-binding protein [Pseudomonadota bacterium]